MRANSGSKSPASASARQSYSTRMQRVRGRQIVARGQIGQRQAEERGDEGASTRRAIVGIGDGAQQVQHLGGLDGLEQVLCLKKANGMRRARSASPTSGSRVGARQHEDVARAERPSRPSRRAVKAGRRVQQAAISRDDARRAARLDLPGQRGPAPSARVDVEHHHRRAPSRPRSSTSARSGRPQVTGWS